VTKRRLYQSAYDRWKKNPNFKAETDIEELSELHDRALANAAGNETFKLGAEGKTRIEVMDELHPNLRAFKEDVAKRVSNLKARLDTATRQIQQGGRETERLESSVRQEAERRAPILERVEELGEDWGPELSYLSGQLREIDRNIAHLRKSQGARAGRALGAIERHGALRAEYNAAVKQLDSLRRAYQNANLEPYRLNQKIPLSPPRRFGKHRPRTHDSAPCRAGLDRRRRRGSHDGLWRRHQSAHDSGTHRAIDRPCAWCA
jgi:chromosome segregation ATPase